VSDLSADDRPWARQFHIQSEVELDFVVSQGGAFPVGMQRRSPPEFRRRVLAGAISYQLRLKSVDYTLKRYVAPDQYESEDLSLGDAVSDYIRNSLVSLTNGLRNLQTEYPAFGVFGAEITLYRLPHSLDTARMLSNRGLLLEVLPILRLCLEMMAWSNSAFFIPHEDKVVSLKAPSCITDLKNIYETAGKIYGYLSTFSHWGHVIHGQFIDITDKQVGVLEASVRYRAMALALCLLILDVSIEVVRKLYPEKSDALILEVQGCLTQTSERKVYQNLVKIVELTGLDELYEIQELFK
jgi:hypothetical protein